MVGNREIIIGRIALKALDRSIWRSDNINVINGGFKASVIIIGLISVRKAVMISDRFFRVLRCYIVSVLESPIAKI